MKSYLSGGRLFFFLLVIFTTLPFVELMLLLWINQQVGLCMTVFIVLSTGFVGAALAKWQGIAIYRTIIFEVSHGRTPTNHMIDGILTLLAGILLITPGVITDITGLMMLFPPSRFLIRELLKREFAKRVKIQIHSNMQQMNPVEAEIDEDENVFDAEYKVVQPKKRGRKPKNIEQQKPEQNG